MKNRPYNVLFLCTGNAGRSIIGEAIVNRLGRNTFRGYSAGSQPRGAVHPGAIRLLQSLGYNTESLRSKSWDEFALPAAPPLDFVFTVCDGVASEVCHVWPGRPISEHWGIPDPTAAASTEAEIDAAFTDTYRILHDRISAFCDLPIEALNRPSIEKRLNEIAGRTSSEP